MLTVAGSCSALSQQHKNMSKMQYSVNIQLKEQVTRVQHCTRRLNTPLQIPEYI